jgi:site-specific DNA-methyltransferase (adenine-specific)
VKERRRNLNAYDRALLAERLKSVIAARAKQNEVAGGKNKGSPTLANPKIDTRAELAKIAGISHGNISKVEKIEALALPEVREQVRRGDISINQGYELAKQASESQKSIADKIVSGAAKTVKDAAKQISQAKKTERKEYTQPTELPETCRLFTGDIHEQLPDIEDNSVDFIITDPPYPREYLSLYGELSRLANRVLKDGGSLLVMSGQSYLPQVMNELRKYMDYHWTLAYLTPGGQSPSLWQKNTNTFWKPVLWFIKGKYKGDFIGDVIKSPVNDNDKRHHEWGQSLGGFREIIEKFTYPGQVILDPFLGGGTTGVCAVTMGRRFIGTDIEQNNIETTKSRIVEAIKDEGRTD